MTAAVRDEVEKKSLIIRAHWRDRQETTSEGGAQLATVLAALAGVHAAFLRWFDLSTSKPSRNPFCAMPPVASELASILERGKQYKDVPREPWPEMGFNAGAWNGANGNDASASFRATIGAYDTTKHAGFNKFDLELKDFGGAGSLVATRVVEAIMTAIVEAMDPDCVDAATTRWLFGTPEATCPAGGLMSYVRNPLGSTLTVPAGIRNTPLDHGVLMVVTDEDFSDADPGHIARANALNTALAVARSLQTAPPGSISPTPK